MNFQPLCTFSSCQELVQSRQFLALNDLVNHYQLSFSEVFRVACDLSDAEFRGSAKLVHDCFDAIYLLTGMVKTGAAVLESAELAMLTDQKRRMDLKNSFVGWSVSSI